MSESMSNKLNISIHAPREGGDYIDEAVLVLNKRISIHAPREGGDGGRRDDNG